MHGCCFWWTDRPCRVTAYPLQDDALRTGELDYINGGNATTEMIQELCCQLRRLDLCSD